jgi:ABC-type Mn2+/Zn2+ transport system permease subunit
MNETLELLKASFVQDALKAALLAAVTCSFLGVFVVLKRIVFVGAALAEASSLGAALAFAAPVIWVFEKIPGLHALEHYRPMILAVLMMLAAVAFFSREGLGRKLPREAIIGAVYAGAVGLTVLALSKVPSMDEHAMDMLSGNILGVQPEEIAEMAIAAVVVAGLMALFFKEFVLVSFDPEVARTMGYRASRWELLWYLMLGMMIAVSIHVAGTVLVFAYLVIPPTAALLLSQRLRTVLFLSVLIGVAATFGGLLISVSPIDVPTSPTITGCLVGILVACWLIKSLAELFRSTLTLAGLASDRNGS